VIITIIHMVYQCPWPLYGRICTSWWTSSTTLVPPIKYNSGHQQVARRGPTPRWTILLAILFYHNYYPYMATSITYLAHWVQVAYIYVCVCVCVCVCVYTHTYICVYMYVCVCVYIYIYICPPSVYGNLHNLFSINIIIIISRINSKYQCNCL
jgi:hypothetical protein